MNDAERFWSKVDRSGGPDACWPWTRYRDDKGYGKTDFDGRTRKTHCVAYELNVGQIPDGLEVCHTCDNRPCCNPAHLFTGTHQQNMDDMVAKGRQARGEIIAAPKRGSRNWSTTLTEEQVLEIRRLAAQGWTNKALGSAYGLSRPAVSCILTGKTWGHVGGPVRSPMSQHDAQLLGVLARRQRTIETVLPVVLTHIRLLIAAGENPTTRSCAAIKGYHAIRGRLSHSEIIRMAVEAA